MPDENDEELEGRLTNVFALILVFLVIAAVVFLGYKFAAPGEFKPETAKFLMDHAVVIYGLPIAALVSFFVVALLRQATGPIAFKGGGLEFSGASGQVVLWVFCFIGIALMMKLLW
jgi:hypothetical protein